MRVLFLVDCYLPSTLSSAKLTHDLALAARDLGHEVVVGAPDPSLDRPISVCEADGITVVRLRTGKLKGVWRPLRALNEWRLSWMMWRGGIEFFRRHPCEAVVFYSPTIFFGGLVRRLKRLWGCKSYLILRDIFPRWAVDAGVLRGTGPVYRFFRRKELEQYAAADWIGVQSPANLTYFEQDQGLDGQELEVLFNWMALDQGEPVRTDFRSSFGLSGRVVFFFGGNIGVAQDMDRLVRLAQALRSEPSLFILIVGDGSEKQRIRDCIRRGGLTNIDVRDSVDQQSYLGMLSEFDVGLLTLDRGLKTHNFPGKMLGYLHSSKPILAAINPGNDLQQILESSESGFVTTAAEDDALIDGARRLLRDPELRRRMGANARRLLERQFSADRAARQILAHFEERSAEGTKS